MQISLPTDVQAVEHTGGLRFRGPASGILQLASELRRLQAAPLLTRCFVAGYVFIVTDLVLPGTHNTVAMPAHAWGVAASKFAEVATGREDSPFDFADCGYLSPAPSFGFGVELLGPPAPDIPITVA